MNPRVLHQRLLVRSVARSVSAVHANSIQQRWKSRTTTAAAATAASDPWHWIKDRDHPKLQQFLKTERTYLAQQLAKPRFRKTERALYIELRRRLVRENATIPERIGSYEYYMQQSPGNNFQIYCRRHVTTNEEEIVLDQNNEQVVAQSFPFVTAMKISFDERWLLLITENENEECAAYIRDLQTQTPLERLEHVTGVRNAEWSNVGSNRRVLYYTRIDAHRRPFQVYRFDCDTQQQELIYTEHDASFFVDVSQTKDGRFILINCNSKTTSEIWTLASDDAFAKPQLLRERQAGTAYFADHALRNAFVLVTNADDAINYKIVTAASSNCESYNRNNVSATIANWTTLVSETPTIKIEDVDLFQDFLVLYERVLSVPRIRILDLNTRATHVVALPAAHATCCSIRPGVNRTVTSTNVRFSISTPLVPEIVYDYNMATAELTVLQELGVEQPAALLASAKRSKRHASDSKSLFDPAQYLCTRLFVSSSSRSSDESDTVDVPLTLIHKRNVVFDGKNPTLLIAYGAYGTNVEAQFEVEHISLIERGWVVALAHVRGGGEMGLKWYHDGRRQHKRHTFDDFAACAHYLITNRITSPQLLAGKGTSAGGLVMGVVANEHPQLFRAMIMKVPFVDIYKTMQDATLPLTIHEYDEWGNPSDDPHANLYIKSYAPLENMRQDVTYPSMLVTGSLNDQRVQFWEPVKWVYRLRQLRRERFVRQQQESSRPGDSASANDETNDRLLLLKVSDDDGHFGGGGRLEQLQESALEMAFLFEALRLPFK